MTETSLTGSKTATFRYRMVFLYLCCAISVAVFVNFYHLYTLVLANLGKEFITASPFILVCSGLLLVATFAWLGRKKDHKYSLPWILCGAALAILALLIPDPNFAVKRIHVAEYLLLSLLVRYTLSHRMSGWQLLLFTWLITSVLGIHDEFLQGLHPSRTYGIRDIAVNSLSAAAGSAIWFGLHLFEVPRPRITMSKPGFSLLSTSFIGWLIISVVMLIIPFASFKYREIPSWLLLPLSTSLLFLSCLFMQNRKVDHGSLALAFWSFLLLIYPALINVLQIPFF